MFLEFHRRHLLEEKYLIQNSPAVTKVCSPQESCCEKRYEIQSGGQEMAMMVGLPKGKKRQFRLICVAFSTIHYDLAPNSPELSLLKKLSLAYHHSHFLVTTFLPLAYHQSHFLAATLDFTSFFTTAF